MKVAVRVYGTHMEKYRIKIAAGERFEMEPDTLFNLIKAGREDRPMLGDLHVTYQATSLSRTVSGRTAEELGENAAEALRNFMKLLKEDGLVPERTAVDISCPNSNDRHLRLEIAKETGGIRFTSYLMPEALEVDKHEAVFTVVGKAIMSVLEKLVPQNKEQAQ